MGNVVTEIKDIDGNVVRRRVQFFCEGPSATKQSMKEECDINGIMKRFEKTGVLVHVEKRQAYFDDVSTVPDFAQAVAVVEKAREMFMSLPATIRREFDNDPASYVAFCADPANLDKMRELGIADPVVKPAPVEVVVTNPDPVKP